MTKSRWHYIWGISDQSSYTELEYSRGYIDNCLICNDFDPVIVAHNRIAYLDIHGVTI
jgi:hypothetical protein